MLDGFCYSVGDIIFFSYRLCLCFFFIISRPLLVSIIDFFFPYLMVRNMTRRMQFFIWLSYFHFKQVIFIPFAYNYEKDVFIDNNLSKLSLEKLRKTC